MILHSEYIKPNGMFYRLDSDIRTDFVNNEILSQILPEDKVSYFRLPDNKILIYKLLERKEQVTLGIRYGKKLRLPLLSNSYERGDYYDDFDFPTFQLVKVLENSTLVEILKTYGDIRDRSRDSEILNDLYNNEIRYGEFEQRFRKLYSNINISTSLYSKSERVDLTHLHTFNIDPEKSKDFDDAISVDIENNKVYIHIVDIAYLTSGKFEEEIRAFYSGFTLYLLERNFNLFPPELSEDRFSLIKDKDREVITVEFDVDVFGNVLSTEIYPSTIRIKERYNYETALEELENNNPYLLYLDKLMWKTSNINIPKRNMILGERGEIDEIVCYTRTKAHKLVESLMIKTNEEISKRLNKKLERYHPESKLDCDLDNLTEQQSIEVIKKFKTAKYSDVESGHFGLQLSNYTHFTSPIRRGFDILVHKMLSGVIYKEEDLEWILNHLNNRERLNDKLIKFYEKCKLFSYMLRHTDELFSATITKVTPSGIRFSMNDVFFTDFVHISKIRRGSYWKLNEEDDELYLYDGVQYIKKGYTLGIKVKEIDWLQMKVGNYGLVLM